MLVADKHRIGPPSTQLLDISYTFAYIGTPSYRTHDISLACLLPAYFFWRCRVAISDATVNCHIRRWIGAWFADDRSMTPTRLQPAIHLPSCHRKHPSASPFTWLPHARQQISSPTVYTLLSVSFLVRQKDTLRIQTRLSLLLSRASRPIMFQPAHRLSIGGGRQTLRRMAPKPCSTRLPQAISLPRQHLSPPVDAKAVLSNLFAIKESHLFRYANFFFFLVWFGLVCNVNMLKLAFLLGWFLSLFSVCLVSLDAPFSVYSVSCVTVVDLSSFFLTSVPLFPGMRWLCTW